METTSHQKTVPFLADCCQSQPIKTALFNEKKPKEYLCGDRAVKPPHDVSPCFPSTGAPSGEAGVGVPAADHQGSIHLLFCNVHLFLSNSVCFPFQDYRKM